MKARLTVLIVIVMLILSACASSGATADVAPSVMRENASFESGAAPAAEPQAAGELYDYASDVSDSNQIERIVIKNANLGIAVDDPAQVMSQIVQLAGEKGGFVVSSSFYKTTLKSGVEVPAANISIRVPAEELEASLDQIKSMVADPETDVLSENVTGQDVTKDYTDLRSRLVNLENTEKQLQLIMDEASKTEDVLSVYNRLVEIRGQIESVKGQIQYYEESAALSMIAVNIQTREAVEPLSIGGWKPVGVARDALQATLDGLKFLANAAIWLVLFVLPIGLVIFLPVRFLWKWLRRNSKKNKQPTPPPAAPNGPPAAN